MGLDVQLMMYLEVCEIIHAQGSVWPTGALEQLMSCSQTDPICSRIHLAGQSRAEIAGRLPSTWPDLLF